MIKEDQIFPKCEGWSWSVICSINMYSLRRFNQCVMFNVFQVFQFLRIVFLAKVKAITIGFEFLVDWYIIEKAPNRQKDGD